MENTSRDKAYNKLYDFALATRTALFINPVYEFLIFIRNGHHATLSIEDQMPGLPFGDKDSVLIRRLI